MSEPVRLIAGEEALQLLHDRTFRSAWDALADACPWSTAFQRAPYAAAWFGVYAPDHVPVIVMQRDEADHLVGLLVLARTQDEAAGHPDDGLAHVGRHQAEYQVWLARPSHAPTFPAAALRAVGNAHPNCRRLRLTYLPADLPMDWIPAVQQAGLHVDRQGHRRGLMRVGADSSIEASLRKSANRSRLARLQRLGPVTLEQVDSREALAPFIDEIVQHCDLRHGALHGVSPFADDPRKREFQLSLLDTPGLAHVSVLRAGTTLVAAHLSVIDPRAIPLGIVTHAPAQAACSPGKLLLLLLGRQLGEQGYRWFDLTPGGDAYKERFASDVDEVWSVDVWFDSAAARAATRRRQRRLAVRGAVQRLLRLGGTRTARLETIVRRLVEQQREQRARHRLISRVIMLCTTAIRQLSEWLWHEREIRSHRSTVPHETAPATDVPFRLDALDDVLQYRPVAPSDRPRRTFLRDALASLERGAVPVTWLANGTLYYCGWMEPDAVLWDDFVHPAARRHGLDDALVRAGFEYVGSRWVGTRFGRRRVRTTSNASP